MERKILPCLLLMFGLQFPVSAAYANSDEDAKAHAVVMQGSPQDVADFLAGGYDVNRVYECHTLLTRAIQNAADLPVTKEPPQNVIKKIQLILNAGANTNKSACPGKSVSPLTWAVTLPLILQESEADLSAILDEKIADNEEYCDIAGIAKPCAQITPEEKILIQNYLRQNAEEAQQKLAPYFVKIVNLLIKRGANINKGDIDKQKILHYAAAISTEGTTGILKSLLDNGAYVDPLDANGRTPLFYAYGAHNDKAVELLFAAGADATMRDKDGILYNRTTAVKLERGKNADGSISIILEN